MLNFKYENEEIKSLEYKKNLVKKRFILSLLFVSVALLVLVCAIVGFLKNHNVGGIIAVIAAFPGVMIYLVRSARNYVLCNKFSMIFSNEGLKFGKKEILYKSIKKCGVIENTVPLLSGFDPMLDGEYCTVYVSLNESVDEDKLKKRVGRKFSFHGAINDEMVYVVVSSSLKNLILSIENRAKENI